MVDDFLSALFVRFDRRRRVDLCGRSQVIEAAFGQPSEWARSPSAQSVDERDKFWDRLDVTILGLWIQKSGRKMSEQDVV